MNLITSRQTEFFQYSYEGKTVIEPGDPLVYKVKIIPLKPIHLQAIQWQLPEVLSSETMLLNIDKEVDPSSPVSYEITFTSPGAQEGFGEIKFGIVYNAEGHTGLVREETIWISVFKRKIAPLEALDDELRQRLVSVVNERPINGHIFLADYVSFFDDFLNIEVPPQIVDLLAQDFSFSDEGLPQNHETYINFILDDVRYYAIEKVELIYEEYCNESDDRFDIAEARDVEMPVID